VDLELFIIRLMIRGIRTTWHPSRRFPT